MNEDNLLKRQLEITMFVTEAFNLYGRNDANWKSYFPITNLQENVEKLFHEAHVTCSTLEEQEDILKCITHTLEKTIKTVETFHKNEQNLKRSEFEK